MNETTDTGDTSGDFSITGDYNETSSSTNDGTTASNSTVYDAEIVVDYPDSWQPDSWSGDSQVSVGAEVEHTESSTTAAGNASTTSGWGGSFDVE